MEKQKLFQGNCFLFFGLGLKMRQVAPIFTTIVSFLTLSKVNNNKKNYILK